MARELADPLSERRLARLLAAFIAAGLVFLVFPGTLAGVWNLVGISSRRDAQSISRIWVQAHGHAQLFGWAGTFMLGISLYTLPKFRGAWIRSLGLGWAMFALWTAALGARWAAAVWDWRWRTLLPAAAAVELAVALLFFWQCSAPGPSRRGWGPWERIILTGFAGLAASLAVQLAAILRPLDEPVVPAGPNALLLWLALWTFCFPVAWGYGARFLPSFLGLRRPGTRSAAIGLALLGAAALLTAGGRTGAGAVLTLGATLAACWSLRIFHSPRQAPKTLGVDPRYPWFARAAFAWLAVSALLSIWGDPPGLTGASRHAFTVGFLGTLILSIGPRLLPSFLNSRELWSSRLMLASMALLAAGCALRVTAQPLAYGGLWSAAWRVLPVSAALELAAILLFAVNLGVTLARPMPAWIERHVITEDLTLYWCVTAYPGTRRLFAQRGLRLPARAVQIPRTLTIRQAAQAEGLDSRRLVDALRDYLEARLARKLQTARR